MASVFHITPVAIGWKSSFNMALILHILLLSSALLLPKILHRKPLLPEVYSVDLINIIESPGQAQPAPPPKAQAPPQKQPPKPKPAQKVAPIAPVVKPESSAPVAKIVSLKPIKRKLKKKIPAEDPALKARRRQAAEQQRRQLLEEARRQKAIADAEAKAAADEALRALKHSLLADSMAGAARNNNNTTGRRGGGTSSSLEAQYFSQIFSHLHQYWSLPEIKPWSPELTAVVVINISKDGKILTHRFERRSGDPVFDRFVTRTIREADPLPAIPGALKKNQYTIGLRFRPGGIQ